MSGDLAGPGNGKVQLESRIGGCVRTNGENETACADGLVDQNDSASVSLDIVSATFKTKRVANPSTASCAVVRATNFD